MSRSQATSLDCSIYVRRYLTKHWSSLGDLSLSPQGRNIVLVPVQSLETNHGVVTLRLPKSSSSLGSLERDVGFIHMKDLVHHSSIRYKRLGISTEPFRQNAHGVAHKAGESNGFRYRRGDKFWLFDKHTSKVDDGGSFAPVCNLHTSEYGTINIADACWYPDVRGPAGDLWTVLGLLREIRGGRGGTSGWTIYRVNQPVSLKKHVFGQVKIEDGGMAKEERKAMYLQKLQAVGMVLEPAMDHPIPVSMSLSPPTSPPALLPSKFSRPGRAKMWKVKREKRPSTTCLDETLPALDLAQRQPVLCSTSQLNNDRLLAARQSESLQVSLQPSALDESKQEIRVASLYHAPMDIFGPLESFSSFARSISKYSSDRCSSPDFDLCGDYGGVRILETTETLADTLHRRSLGGFRQPSRPYSSFLAESAGSVLGSNTIIAKRGFRKTTDNQINIEVGEVVTDVEYSAAEDIAEEHFWRGRNSRGSFGEFPSWVSGHDSRCSLPFKNVPKYDLAELFPGRCREARPHRCCITYSHPAPGLRGGCILGGRPRSGFPHICCTWSAEVWNDSGVPRDAEPEFDDRKLRECMSLPACSNVTYDRTALAEERRAVFPTDEAPYIMKKITGIEW